MPADTIDFKINNKVGAEPHRRVRLNAVLFADKGPDDGDRSAGQVLRFERLGGFLEENRCLRMLNRLDPSMLDDASVTQLLASVGESPKTLDEALGSLTQDPQSRVGSDERIRGASADARKAFLTKVRAHRYWCNERVRRLTKLAASPETERTVRVKGLRLEYQRAVDTLRPLCERDMEVEQ